MEPIMEQTITSENIHIWSGGAKGSDFYWGEVASYYGTPSKNIHHLYYQSRTPHGNQEISVDAYTLGVNAVHSICIRLNRRFSMRQPVRYLLARNYSQVLHGEEIFAIAENIIPETQVVSGGTGWAIEMVKLYFPEKPCYVYSLEKKAWYIWSVELERFVRYAETPKITKHNITCIGTRNITRPEALSIMDDVFYRIYKSRI